MSVADALLIVATGVVTGALSAIFGVGGGLLIIPFMVLVMGASQQLAEGTSLAVIIPTALAGAWVHHRSGLVAWRAAAYIATGGVVAAGLGALLAVRADELVLRRLYAVVTLVVAYRFLRGR